MIVSDVDGQHGIDHSSLQSNTLLWQTVSRDIRLAYPSIVCFCCRLKNTAEKKMSYQKLGQGLLLFSLLPMYVFLVEYALKSLSYQVTFAYHSVLKEK